MAKGTRGIDGVAHYRAWAPGSGHYWGCGLDFGARSYRAGFADSKTIVRGECDWGLMGLPGAAEWVWGVGKTVAR